MNSSRQRKTEGGGKKGVKEKRGRGNYHEQPNGWGRSKSSRGKKSALTPEELVHVKDGANVGFGGEDEKLGQKVKVPSVKKKKRGGDGQLTRQGRGCSKAHLGKKERVSTNKFGEKKGEVHVSGRWCKNTSTTLVEGREIELDLLWVGARKKNRKDLAKKKKHGRGNSGACGRGKRNK